MTQRAIPPSLRWLGYAIYGFLYLPLAMVVLYSFNSARFSVRWQGFSWHWYGTVLHNRAILSATQNTLVLALVSTLIATVLGSMLGYGLYRYQFPGKGWVQSVMYLPVVIPDIVMAIALVLFFKAVRMYTGWFELGMSTMVVSHITFQLAFVAIVVRSRLQTLSPALEEAARDLYADGFNTFRYVILPQTWPGIITAALLAFTLSIDDFVISFFTSSPSSITLPIWIYGAVRRGVTTEINVISTLVFLLTGLTVVGYTLSQSLRSK